MEMWLDAWVGSFLRAISLIATMRYFVQQGDCLSSIAKHFGFGDWRTIYEHPGNSAFRQLRPNPNLIFPNDELFIPELSPRQDPASTGAKHKFVLSGVHA